MTSSPDSALFVSMFDGAVHRSIDLGASWEQIVLPDTTTGVGPSLRELILYAPSRQTFFAISGDRVLRWDGAAGLRTARTPISNSLQLYGDAISGHRLSAIWGRGENDVFAVGEQGVILHFDGKRWTLESNPLSRRSPGPGWWYPEGMLFAVGGDRQHVYAAGSQTLRSTGDGNWVSLPTPARRGERLGVFGIASHDGPPIFGGQFNRTASTGAPNPIRFFRPTALEGEPWEMLWAGPYREFLRAGTSSSRARSIFWTLERQLLIVDERTVTAYVMPMLTESVRGAAVVGAHTFVAGIARDTGMVVRIPTP